MAFAKQISFMRMMGPLAAQLEQQGCACQLGFSPS